MASKKDQLSDAGLERAVITGIIEYGSDTYFDVADILDVKDFFHPINRNLFAILRHLVTEKDAKTFDIISIATCAKNLSFKNIAKQDFIETLFDNAPVKSNIVNLAAAVYKLSLARQAYTTLEDCASDILTVTGEESAEAIVAKLEDPIFELTGKLTTESSILKPIADNFSELMKAVSESPKDLVGLPTGFPNWDYFIGGGLRRGTVTVIGARPKIGKSFMCLNVAKNVAEMGIPVLYLDTELTQRIQMERYIALMTGIELNHIETGKFASISEENKLLWDSQPEIEKLSSYITHCSIAGQPVQHVVLPMIRRWLARTVGFNEFGQANTCLVVYDYIRIMDPGDIKNNLLEHQILGILMSSLHDFCVKWDLPTLAAVQINREGKNKDGGEFIFGSDKILQSCSSLTLLKPKTPEDLMEDPPTHGTKKMIVTDTRFGPGMEPGEYINIIDNLVAGKFVEGNTCAKNIAESSILNEPI